MSKKILVIGGGVVGTACAYYLARRGHTVKIIERKAFGSGCSHANCGYVSPSHVLPLATPGAISTTLRAMLRKNSPFYIKPRFSWALWSWLFKFARRCNEKAMLESAAGITALLNSSREMYDTLFEEEGFDPEWQTRGLVFAFMTSAGMEHHAEAEKCSRERFGIGANRLDGEALNQLEPALLPGLAGGFHYEMDAHLRSDKLMSDWRNVITRHGVEVIENCGFESFVRQNGHATAAQTSQGEIEADTFVLATGAWTPQLKLDLGCKIPIQPGKGYSMTMAKPNRCPKYPMMFEEHRVAVTPMQSGYRLGSIMEFAGYNDTLDVRRMKILTESAKLYLHEPTAEPVMERWTGWRPMTYDSRPLIGPAPAVPNVYLAAGHNMLGLSMATGTGTLIAEMIEGREPHVSPEAYSPARF
ncbi:MAG: FAD-dependent oxidoreductase [Pirellulales bacterium]|nr:FAD-dependent oxidoreductase [Pirellulales bacterium]